MNAKVGEGLLPNSVFFTMSCTPSSPLLEETDSPIPRDWRPGSPQTYLETVVLICVAQRIKNLPAMQEVWVRSLGQEDRLEEGMATHSSILVDRKSTRLNSSHKHRSRMPSSA